MNVQEQGNGIQCVDSVPLSAAQLRAVGRAAGRELTWGLHAVTRELHAWRRRAAAIPDERLRADALHALGRKRGHADGAALFATLPCRRDAGLLRLLVAFEALVDFLDDVSERHPVHANGLRLHGALRDALDADRPLGDWYGEHPWRDDGGYLAALVAACRDGCRALPSYEPLRPLLARESRRLLVLGINHDADAAARDAALRAWAEEEHPHAHGLAWFELAAASSATLHVLALIALASADGADAQQAARLRDAYWPWVALATTMVDGYVDQADDRARGQHNYLAHYAAPAAAAERLAETIARALAAVRTLPDGERHAVIVAGMVAMYLSKAGARSPALRATTAELVAAGGPLVRLLLPPLRAWRIAYRQRTA